MDRQYTQILIALLFAIGLHSVWAGEELSDQEILERIVEKAEQNQELSSGIGFHQTVATTKIRDGKVAEMKVHTYKVTWIQNEPYLELVQVNGQELSSKDRKEERERRTKFIKSIGKKKDDDEEDRLAWEDLYTKYDFRRLPTDSVGRYVFSFYPKAGKLRQRSRMEKVLNHVTGTFWADDQFDIVRVQAKLLDNVRFGLGILGNLEKFQLTYEQTDFDKIRVPSYFSIHFRARIALLKTEERKIEGTYKDYFRRESAR